MKPKHQSTAARLLEIVFEGHHIRTLIKDGKPLFDFYECASACMLSKPKDFAKRHLEPHHLQSIFVDCRSANGIIQKRHALHLTQSGVLAMVMACRTPAARRFQAFILEDVLPQLIELGTFIEGITPAERIRALGLRYRQERAAMLEADAAFLAESGLLQLQSFRLENAIPARDALPFSRRVFHMAKVFGIPPVKRFVKGAAKNPVNVWPRHILCAAANSIIPRLPFTP
jgi:prophage antirepressor-like protein